MELQVSEVGSHYSCYGFTQNPLSPKLRSPCGLCLDAWNMVGPNSGELHLKQDTESCVNLKEKRKGDDGKMYGVFTVT